MNNEDIIEKIAILYDNPWSMEYYTPEEPLKWENNEDKNHEDNRLAVRDIKNMLEAAHILGYALTPIIKPHD